MLRCAPLELRKTPQEARQGCTVCDRGLLQGTVCVWYQLNTRKRS